PGWPPATSRPSATASATTLPEPTPTHRPPGPDPRQTGPSVTRYRASPRAPSARPTSLPETDSRPRQPHPTGDSRLRQPQPRSHPVSQTRHPHHQSPTVPDVARPPLGTVTPDPRPSPPRVGTAHNRPRPPDLRKELLTAEHGKRVSRTTRHPRRTSAGGQTRRTWRVVRCSASPSAITS